MKKLFSSLLFLVLVGIIFFSCKENKSNYPEIIVRHNLEEQYDLAKWELYKLNCVIEENGNQVDFLVPEFGEDENYRRYQKEFNNFTKKEKNIWEGRSKAEEIYGRENVFDFIDCGLIFFSTDSSLIFEDGKINLCFFPECDERRNTFIKLHRNFYVAIVFEQNQIVDYKYGRFISTYPKSEQSSLEQKFIEIIKTRKDKIHPWILEYYQNHKK